MPEVATVSGDSTLEGALEPVRKNIRVRASAARAFQVFTEGMDTWWPRMHHIGSSPMKRVVVEGRPDGAIYTDQEDGTACPWGTVLVWDPPHRFVFAWQISSEWKYEPDLAKCSDVVVTFTPADDGTTLVELEHRGIHKHGGAWLAMRAMVNAEGGWGTLLGLFGAIAEKEPA